MKKGILWMLLSFLLVAALVLASCAVDEGEQEKEEEEEEEEEEDEEVGPQYGGTLTIATMRCTWNAPSWDCNIGGTWNTSYFVSPFLPHLFTGDVSKGMTGTGEHLFSGRYVDPEYLKGDVCESWEILRDPLRLILNIRQGVYWQGKPGVMETREFEADDVVFTLDRRIADPAAEFKLEEWIKSVTATDKFTVTLELHSLYPDWMACIGLIPWSAITPPELVEAGIEDWRNQVGTGPFMLTDYIEGSLVEYTRNPNYWDTTVIDGVEYQIPFVDKLVWAIIVDEATQLANLRTGKLDIWEKAPWVYRDTLAASDPELRRWEVEGWAGGAISIRQDIGPPFDILKVRQAMNMAIDKQAIIDDLYGGYGVMLNYPFARSWGEVVYTPLEKLPEASRELFEYNPEKARELLTEAGYPGGFDFNVECVVGSVPLNISVMSLVKDYWADIGITLDLITVEPTVAWSMTLAGEQKHMTYDFGDSPTAPLSVSSEWTADAAASAVRWDDPVVEDLWARYKVEEDPVIQGTLMKEIFERVIAQTPAIILPGFNHFRYAWPWVMNYEGESNSAYLTSVGIHSIIWIDQDLKEIMGY